LSNAFMSCGFFAPVSVRSDGLRRRDASCGLAGLTPGARPPGFSFQRCVGMSDRASSSAARHRPHITIIGIQNRNGMLSSSVVSRRDNATNATALRQDFVIG
jgi:hypothetical protein